VRHRDSSNSCVTMHNLQVSERRKKTPSSGELGRRVSRARGGRGGYESGRGAGAAGIRGWPECWSEETSRVA
jgi:hypothetical protein